MRDVIARRGLAPTFRRAHVSHGVVTSAAFRKLHAHILASATKPLRIRLKRRELWTARQHLRIHHLDPIHDLLSFAACRYQLTNSGIVYARREPCAELIF